MNLLAYKRSCSSTVIPAMDQVFKDCVIRYRPEHGWKAGMVGKRGEEEMAEILGRLQSPSVWPT